MKNAVISINEVREIGRRLEALKKHHQALVKKSEPGTEPPSQPFPILLDHCDLLQLFRISRRTSGNWRKQGLLPYIKIRGKIYFRLSEVEEFLRKL